MTLGRLCSLILSSSRNPRPVLRQAPSRRRRRRPRGAARRRSQCNRPAARPSPPFAPRPRQVGVAPL